MKSKRNDGPIEKNIEILYIISDVDFAPSFELIAKNSREWPKIRISFCFLSASLPALATNLLQEEFPVYQIKLGKKTDWPVAFALLLRLLKKRKPSAIHCHLRDATIIGLTAGYACSIPTRIYTRHHSSLHHRYHPKGIIIDRICNALATKIVSISPIVKKILIRWEGTPEKKIVDIPHGFPIELFSNVADTRPTSFKERHNIPPSATIVGVVSRFVQWKGVDDIIEGFRLTMESRPNLHLVILNASGPYQKIWDDLKNKIPPTHFTTIKFEEDMPAAFRAMSYFVHTPIDSSSEAFGQVYIEALAAGVPSVFTMSGIAHAFIEHNKNALVVPFRSPTEISRALIQLIDDPNLASRLSRTGLLDVRAFRIEEMFTRLRSLYSLP